MITVTTFRSYPDATAYGTGADGALRVYKGTEVIAQYEAGIEHTVTYEPDDPPLDPFAVVVTPVEAALA